MGWPNVFLLMAIVAARPPSCRRPFRGPARQRFFENDVVAVWNVSWLKQQYPLHTHRYDLVGVSYVEGDRIITQGNAPGRLVNTKAWVFQTNRANVTHVEEGASDPPMRAVLIEVKTPAPRPATTEPPDGLRQVAGAPAWENNRAAAWAGDARIVRSDAPPRRRRRRAGLRWIDDAESGVRAGGNGARRAHAGRRRRGRTSSRSSREER